MKYLLGLIGACAVIAGVIVGTGFYLSPQDPLRSADAIVAISGGETDLRVKESVKLYQQHWAPLLIMSGAARDEGESNAEAMQRLAVNSGIPPDRILVEKEAKTTVDNAIYIKQLLADHQVHSIILVTSPYHQRRAFLTFAHYLGAQVAIINHSAADSAWRKNGWWKDAWARKITLSELQKIAYLAVVFAAHPKASILDG